MTPAYVAYVLDDHIRLDGDTSSILDAISKSKYVDRLFQDKYGLNISFINTEKPLENKDLLELFQWLNEHEVLFSIDKGWGPSEIMQELQKRGILRDSFNEIAWKGPGLWFTTKRSPMK